jgi:hypothetical protein
LFKKSLGKNAYGVERIFHYDPDTEESYVEYQSDAEHNIEYAKRLQNEEGYSKEGIKKGMWHYGHIPPIIQLKWLNEYGPQNDPMKPENSALLFRLLNSREYRYLKTTNKIHIPKG